MNTQLISIIIPAWHDPHITECLASLQRLAPVAGYAVEIILVDNHPTPTLQNIAQEYNVRYVHEPVAGSYQARNTGLATARGQILAFTDSDCTVDKHWLENIVTALNNKNVQGVMGQAHGNDTTATARYEQRMYEANVARFVTTSALERIDTRNFAIKRSVYERIGGFTAQLKYGGDMEYGARAHAAELTIVYVSTMIVYHANPSTLPALLRKRRRQNYGNMLLLELHPRSFIERYFPHLLRYHAASTTRLWYYLLRSYAAITFWWPWSMCYRWFKLQNVLAIHLGQLDYIFHHAPTPR